MSILQWLTFILDTLADEQKHFLLSSVMGCLGFAWTWITLFASFYGVACLTRRPTSTAVAYGILICSLLVGVSFALAAHWGLDYWQQLYTTPLNPPLQLRPGA
jgi:CHASE2 domain-containing sensor protein